ncbi:transporter substrate-binding domain-containing protein [Hespellia stercorisuis]|uniref:Amino acid ABC transporter substrate-binding protein, PAAT family n=1 Tax=Hespellia stercorisuis DSM 15480 TaxID=1121950 RepID=A0A1M6JJY0_9FIRM|nr:transporter substrate-binding domain-containing protein [Hespellia stercorisuis]SHJ47041.1 amino acid ABC transporter substrate-binding protein, PAAT family [Hespellia stercorisuis DSM 15480]
MKMKKILSAVLVAACAVSLAACGGSGKESGSAASGSTSAKIETPDDLEGKKIGVQTGTTGDLYVTDDYGDESVERYNKGFEAVQALTQGKIDAVVIDDQPAKTFVEENKGLKILDTAYTEEDYAMCFKKDSELVPQFNTAIKELKEDGTFDQIVSYYIDGEESGEAVRYESPADTDRSKGSLVMATNAEFPPYEYYEGDAVVGIDADFAQAIADKLGMELKIEDMAFDSIITAVQGGKADFGAAGMTVTEERATQVDFTDSYYTGRQVIIVKE